MNRRLFTSESVTEGHPDKLCDQIADAILDEILRQDPLSRVACEVTATTGMVNIMGEISTNCYVDIPKIARKTITEIGYDRAKYGFDGTTCGVVSSIDEQSRDIAQGVDKGYENRVLEKEDPENALGAGDQGMMFGYACDETAERMPLSISLAHRLARSMTELRKNGTLPYLRPDGKTQVTIEYGETGRPERVHTVVVSTQHAAHVSQEQLQADLTEQLIRAVIPPQLLDRETKIFINPTGRFVIGGPHGDSGLTGRKIIVDTYGGWGRHGGGSFSGKDPTKVDRSAAYAARWVAVNLVAAELASRCEIQLAYAIGVAHPVSIMVDTFGTGRYADDQIAAAVREVFDLRPHAIITALDLRRPMYRPLAAYGHMGRRDLSPPWEQENRVAELLSYFSQQG